MNKLYGYKDKEVLEFISFLQSKKPNNLKKAFNDFAEQKGKSAGTVRNMYYSIAKKSREDKEFRDEFLGGKEICVGKIEKFSAEEEKELIKNVLNKKSAGFSVRKAIMDLSNGDDKLCLRYQNKFRNVIKSNPALVNKDYSAARLDKTDAQIKNEKIIVTDVTLIRLKKEINFLVERLTKNVKEENKTLKDKIILLELENLKLKRELQKENSTKAFFKSRENGELVN